MHVLQPPHSRKTQVPSYTTGNPECFVCKLCGVTLDAETCSLSFRACFLCRRPRPRRNDDTAVMGTWFLSRFDFSVVAQCKRSWCLLSLSLAFLGSTTEPRQGSSVDVLVLAPRALHSFASASIKQERGALGSRSDTEPGEFLRSE